jgi:hypothetical protein
MASSHGRGAGVMTMESAHGRGAGASSALSHDAASGKENLPNKTLQDT